MSTCLLAFSSCRFWQGTTDNSGPGNSSIEANQNAPFSTKEPDEFQVEVVVSSFPGDETIERKYVIAKSGSKVLATYGVNEENSISTLSLSTEEKYTIRHRSKTIEKERVAAANAGSHPEENWRDFLTTKLLNEKRGAKFELLGRENGLEKYRVTIDGSTNSEIFIFVDKEIGLPVLQEFYSVEGDKKSLTQKIELKNFKNEVPAELFELPKDYTRNWDER